MTAERPLTDGTIALQNLDAQIEALEVYAGPDRAEAVEARASLVELLTLRGLIVGRIADYDRAERIAEELVRDAPADASAWVARAGMRCVFHRFEDALADFDRAELLSLDAEVAARERAAVFQGLGRYDEALALRMEAVDRRESFESIAALASLYAERGEVEAAEGRFAQSRSCYRGVSPIPLVQLDFQRGLMWMGEGDLGEAERSFKAAQRAVPGYAPALGHLAEVEAELGNLDSAVMRLRPLAESSDDPDYAAQLARILGDAGCENESRHWREVAAARYQELIARRPEAFADHAAEFWLAAGGDPDKALELARFNASIRDTPRARHLLAQATGARAS
jgi:tetratricopeptide (TPR) repeat protein